MANYSTLSYDQLWTIIFRNPLSGAEAEHVLGEVRNARDSFGFGLPDLAEPLTYDKVRDYVASKRGTANDKATIAGIYRDGLTSGRLPSLAADADRAVADATLPGGWVERLVRALISSLTDPATWQAISNLKLADYVNIDLQDFVNTRSAATKFLSDPSSPLDKYIRVNAAGIATLIEVVLGLTVPTSTVQAIMDGSITSEDRKALGEIVKGLFDDNLSATAVAEGWKQRNPGPAEVDNMARMFGGAMRIQIGGLLLSALNRFLPKDVGKFLDKVVESVDKSVNLDDAIEEIIQPIFEATIVRGLEAQFNRMFLPADLSATEALQATIAGKLSQEDLTKILNNGGYRPDIRQILRDFAAKNLTESDINDSYQWNLLTREQVKQRYRDVAYEEPDAELKTKLVELTRRQKLREKVFELYGNLYRDGVATKQEVTPFLENYGYDADEVEMWFQVQELERRQRKWLTNSQIDDMLEGGRITLIEARQYQVMQGMTEADATRYYAEVAVKAAMQKLPKAVKDECAEILKPEQILTQLLGELLSLTGLGGIADAKMRELMNCLISKLNAPTTP